MSILSKLLSISFNVYNCVNTMLCFMTIMNYSGQNAFILKTALFARKTQTKNDVFCGIRASRAYSGESCKVSKQLRSDSRWEIDRRNDYSSFTTWGYDNCLNNRNEPFLWMVEIVRRIRFPSKTYRS